MDVIDWTGFAHPKGQKGDVYIQGRERRKKVAREEEAEKPKRKYTRQDQTGKPRSCIVCRQEFRSRRQSRSGQWMRCCSWTCERKRRAEKHPPLRTNCATCGKALIRYCSHRRKSRTGNFFCSVACRTVMHTGETSPLYRGTEDPNRGSGWKRLAAKIRERDGHICQRCGRLWVKGAAFPVDHIIPWRAFTDKEAANDPSNLATLCRSCHTQKTIVAERLWLNGDTIAMSQYRRAISLPSQAYIDARGEMTNRSIKHPTEHVVAIRASDESQASLSRRYGISKSQIGRIRRGESRKCE